MDSSTVESLKVKYEALKPVLDEAPVASGRRPRRRPSAVEGSPGSPRPPA